MAIEKKNAMVKIIFTKNYVYQLSSRTKKHSLRQVVPMTYTLEKMLFTIYTFEGFYVFTF